MPFCFRFLRFVAVVCLVLCVGLFTSAGVLETWWTKSDNFLGKEYTIKAGLWRICEKADSNTVCKRRDDIMQFKGNTYWNIKGLDLDIIILSLSMAVLGAMIHLACVLRTMCQNPPRKRFIAYGSIFLLFSAMSGVFGLVWALMKVSSDNQGWSFYLLYAADGLSILVLVLSIALSCMSATRSSFNDDEIAMLKR